MNTDLELLKNHHKKIIKQRHYRVKNLKTKIHEQRPKVKSSIPKKVYQNIIEKQLQKENINENQQKNLKNIVLKHKKTFKINKIKRYATENKTIVDHIYNNIQSKLKNRNNFQFQKDVFDNF